MDETITYGNVGEEGISEAFKTLIMTTNENSSMLTLLLGYVTLK